MGQIVAENAKPKRCNRQALETGGSLAEVALQDGEYVLVSSDNTVSQSGNGIFDSYVVGDGTTLGKNLPVHNILDKTYDTSVFSGLGSQIIPKNIQTIGGVTKNVLTQAMLNSQNTILRVLYNFDLNGQTISIPSGCVLQFEGGSLANGTIVFNGTAIKAEGIVFKSDITISESSTIAGDVKVGWFANIENDSAKLNTLLNSGADNIYLNKIVYHVHGTKRVVDENIVDSQSNTYRKYNIGGEWLFCLLLNNITSKIHWNGATLQQDAESVSTCPIIGLINCHNIEICDVTIIGDKLTHTITTGQWCHGIAILPDCSDIEIHDVTIKENYGDGICLVNNSVNEEQATFYAKNISIHDCIFGNTIRNNISVISGENIDVRNNIFRRVDSDLNADGTALVTNCNAHLFIDMEVNYAWQAIKNVNVVDNSMYSNKIAIHNTSGGISFNSKGILDNVRIIGNTIENCYYYGISWGSNNPSSLFFIKGNVIIGNSTYGALYSLTLTKSIIKNNVFKGIQIGILGNGRVNVNGSDIVFPISSKLNIYDCIFIGTPASSVYVANFFGCNFINSANLEANTTRFVNCHFENCGTITCMSYNNMTDAQKETALQNKEALEARGYVVGEDGDTYLSHDGNKFISCEFDGNSNETNPLLLNNGENDVFVLQDTIIHNVNTSAYIFRTITDKQPVKFDNVTFDNISSSIYTTGASLPNTDILLRKVTIRNISVEASTLRPIYIGNAKSVLFEDCNIEYSNLYMSSSGTTVIQILSPAVAEIKNTIINTPSSSYRDRFLGSYKTAFGTLRNVIVNGVSFFADAAGAVGSRPGAPSLGLCYFNTTNGKPMWYNGTDWVDATGTVVV